MELHDLTNSVMLFLRQPLVPALYQSGEMRREQGITRAGNAHVRRVMVQLAWGWVRYQPTSALTRWYQRRFGGRGALGRGRLALSRSLASSWSRCGGTWKRALCLTGPCSSLLVVGHARDLARASASPRVFAGSPR